MPCPILTKRVLGTTACTGITAASCEASESLINFRGPAKTCCIGIEAPRGQTNCKSSSVGMLRQTAGVLLSSNFAKTRAER